ncbi:MAG: hypothetical protein RL385_885 [Pseudomonadota bacterium]|jgi:hypothetical protein
MTMLRTIVGRHGSSALAVAAAALGAALTSHALDSAAAPVRAARAQATVEESRCSGGGQGDVSVSLMSVDKVGALRSLRAVATHDAADDATVAVVFEVLDARNKPVGGSKFSEPSRVKRGIAQESALTVPEGLDDGYYQLRVTAAVSANGKVSSSTDTRAVRVTNGSAVPVSQEEFYTKSGANNGIAL